MCLTYIPDVVTPPNPDGKAAWVIEPMNLWEEPVLKVCIPY